MSEHLIPTLLKALLPLLGIVFILFAARRKKLSFQNDIGLRAPVVSATVLFSVVWIALVATGELFDASAPKAWKDYPAQIVVLRIVAIGVLGPIAEELAFRGLMLSVLSRTRLGIFGAVVAVATLWAMVHIQYEPATLALLFIDGVVLGFARHFTRSLYVPIAMHIGANLFSIAQSLQSAA